MIYIFDTSAFVTLKHFYPSTFPTLWSGIENLTATGDLVSVREVLNELDAYNDTDLIQVWARNHKKIFLPPTAAEQQFVVQIFSVQHFQALISRKALLKGTPVADPFVIASAKIRNGTVVTQEQSKPNAAKVPNVCTHFGIPCITLEKFMGDQGWSF